MAVKARTFQEAKSQSGSNLELAWWVFMRVSGTILIFLTVGHIYMNFVVIDVNTIKYDYVADRLSNTTWKIYDWLILALAMLHGMNGLRYVMDDWVINPIRRFWTKVGVYGLCLLAFTIGSISLFNHDFTPAQPKSSGEVHSKP